MKRVLTILTAVMLAACTAISASAVVIYPKDYPDFGFEKEFDDSYTVKEYTGTDPEVHIPETLYDCDVKRVGDNAFMDNSNIVSLYFHDKMTNVSKWAVRNCANLEYVYYSRNFSYFWDYAFAKNVKLQDALLRNTKLDIMYQGCYSGDKALRRVALPDGISTLSATAFSTTAIESIVIPDSVVKIDNMCFSLNPQLKKVYIPSSVTTFGNNIFMNSKNVTVYTTSGSVAQSYCESNNISCEVISQMPSDTMGDVNFDNVPDDKDIDAMRAELNMESADFNARNCDMNGDCRFDINDVTELQAQLEKEYTIVYNYKRYNSIENKENVSLSINAKTCKTDISEIAKQYMPKKIKSPYVKYYFESATLSGSTISVSIADTPKYYTVNFNGEKTEFRYKQTATLNSDEDCYFITNGRPVARGKSYSFYVTSDAEFTSAAESSLPNTDYALIDFNSYTITDERITLELLATAGVSSFERMGVAFAKTEADSDSIKQAVANVTSATGSYNNIVVHNSAVSDHNCSGQYQFIYAPYLSVSKAENNPELYFYTYAVNADGDTVISDGVKVNLLSALE